jgi:steroid 5-alpha reductase family enzyme
MKKDSRFDGVRENFFKFLKFWLLQAIAVWVILLPSIATFSIESPILNILAYVGLAIYLLGLIIESFADYQKYTFINNEDNKGMWIDSGLWKYSRHPNYLGEMMVWIGVYIFTLSSLTGILPFIMLASPLFIILLLIFGSGIPMLEKSANKRWGDNPKYQEYKKRVGVLLPKIL